MRHAAGAAAVNGKTGATVYDAYFRPNAVYALDAAA